MSTTPSASPQPPKRPTAKEMLEHAQTLPYPAKQADMKFQPQTSLAAYRAAGKLEGKVNKDPNPWQNDKKPRRHSLKGSPSSDNTHDN